MALDRVAYGFSGKKSEILTDGKDNTCFETEYTYEPFIDIDLGREIEVHSIHIFSQEDIPTLDVFIGDIQCVYDRATDRSKIVCENFPTGKSIRLKAFSLESRLKLCEVEIYGGQSSSWTEWGEWSQCKNDCHFGVRRRERFAKNLNYSITVI